MLLDRAPARYHCATFVLVAGAVDVLDYVDFVGFVNFVDQAGAGIWGIPAASPQRRGGWSPWQPRKGSAEDRESRW